MSETSKLPIDDVVKQGTFYLWHAWGAVVVIVW
jgi:hypothetical protein